MCCVCCELGMCGVYAVSWDVCCVCCELGMCAVCGVSWGCVLCML